MIEDGLAPTVSIAPSPLIGSPLIGRAEIESALAAFLARLEHRDGGLLVIEADAGIGKTALLDRAVGLADDRGIRVARAVGAAVESTVSWGVVRQLFGPSLRRNHDVAALLVSAAGPDSPAPFAAFEAMYWLMIDAVEQVERIERTDSRPLLLVVDDAHWVDEPSLRWIDFVSRRLSGLPIGVLVATRPHPDRTVLDEAHRAIMHPSPLTRADVDVWLGSALTVAPAPSFVDEVVRLTGGNALLMSELVREVRALDLTPDDHAAGRLAGLAPREVESSVRRRMGELTTDERAVIAALAVLGSGMPAVIARVTGRPVAVVDTALEWLVARGLVNAGSPARFVHPMIQASVHRQLPAPERVDTHAAAAEVLHAAGAGVELVAAHLLRGRPVGPGAETWTITTLVEAAELAFTAGSPAVSVHYLQQAIAAGANDRSMRLRLARVLAEVDPRAAEQHLTDLLEQTSDPDERCDAAIELARIQRERGAGAGAAGLLLAARDRLPANSPRRRRLDLELLACMSVSRSARLRLAGRAARFDELPTSPGDRTWHRMIEAGRALDGALDGHPRREVQQAVAAGLDGITADPPALAGVALSLVGLAQMLIDEFDAAEATFDVLVEATRTPERASRHAAMMAQRASLWLRRGQLAEANAEAGAALELARATGTTHALLPRAAATVVAVAALQGTRPPLEWIISELDIDNLTNRLLMYSRAELLFAEGNLAAAAATYERYGAINVELGWAGVASPWRSQLARSLGDPRRARDLVEEELAIAARSELPRAIGVARHAQVLIGRGDDGRFADAARDQLTRAHAELATSAAPLEQAAVLADLGRAHLQHGARADARDVLRQAWTLAEQCGATVLRRGVEADLKTVGAPPAALPRALTRSERTVAQHAARGLTNRQIARSLFVTEKTVEAHLRAAFRKLGINSRTELPDHVSG